MNNRWNFSISGKSRGGFRRDSGELRPTSDIRSPDAIAP
jgi:hypothetical protein